MKTKLLAALALGSAFAVAAAALVWVNTSVSAQDKVAAAPAAQPAPIKAPAGKVAPAKLQLAQAKAPAAADAAAAQTGINKPGPRIQSPEPEFNFGSQDNAEKVHHDFIVKNVGEAPLEIAKVKTSCGCTVAELKKKTLLPGEETTISATLSIAGKSGPQTKHLTVESNDPIQPLYRLTLTGNAMASINVEPRSVSFGRILDEQPAPKSITIEIDKKRRPIKVTAVESTAPDQFTTELKTIEEGGKYEVVVTPAANLQPGPHQTRLTIKTDDPKNSNIISNVSAHVVGELDITPPKIFLTQSDKPGETRNQFVRITAGRVKEFEIQEVVAPSDGIEIEITPRAKNDYLIQLKNMPVDGSLDGKELTIKTNIENKPEIKIPFVVTARRGPARQIPAAAGAAGAH